MHAKYDCTYAYYAVPVMTAKCKLITLSCLLHVCTTSMPGKKQEKERKKKKAAAMYIRLVFMMEWND